MWARIVAWAEREPVFASYWIGFVVGGIIVFGVLHP